jgi:hypothetical protein
MTTQRKISFTVEPFIYTLTVYENKATLKAIHNVTFHKWMIDFPDIDAIYLMEINTDPLVNIGISIKIILNLLEDYNRQINNAYMALQFPNSYVSPDEILSIQLTGFFCYRDGMMKSLLLTMLPIKTVHSNPISYSLTNIALIAQVKIGKLSNMLTMIKDKMDPRILDRTGKIPFMDEALKIFNEIETLVNESQQGICLADRGRIFQKMEESIIKIYTDAMDNKKREIINAKSSYEYTQSFFMTDLNVLEMLTVRRIRKLLNDRIMD